MEQEWVIKEVEEQLFEMQDLKYRDFHAGLMPNIDKNRIIGVRTPQLRKFAKEYGKTAFYREIPHQI